MLSPPRERPRAGSSEPFCGARPPAGAPAPWSNRISSTGSSCPRPGRRRCTPTLPPAPNMNRVCTLLPCHSAPSGRQRTPVRSTHNTVNELTVVRRRCPTCSARPGRMSLIALTAHHSTHIGSPHPKCNICGKQQRLYVNTRQVFKSRHLVIRAFQRVEGGVMARSTPKRHHDGGDPSGGTAGQERQRALA